MVLDIKLVLNNEQIINLEMQVANLGNWPERSLTYLCRMFDQLKSGDDYQNVKKTLHIGIMDFTPEDFPKVLYSNYFLYNLENKHKYSDKFGIYMLQLNQIGDPKDEKERPELYYWAQFFKATTWEEIKMLAQKNESISQGIVTLKQLTADEKMQMQMEARERYRRDMVACEEYGRRQNAKLLAQQEKLIQGQKDTIQEQNSIIQAQEKEIQLLKQQLAQQNSNTTN